MSAALFKLWSAWILSLILASLPANAPPTKWASTYPETAEGIAYVVTSPAEKPLFEGPDGRARTATLLVALARFESTFQPGAKGDCGHPGLCKEGETAKSHGLFQVQGYGDLTDPKDATRAAMTELRASMRGCAAHPLDDRLAFYASGGAHGCDNHGGILASRHRMFLAKKLFREHPLQLGGTDDERRD